MNSDNYLHRQASNTARVLNVANPVEIVKMIVEIVEIVIMIIETERMMMIMIMTMMKTTNKETRNPEPTHLMQLNLQPIETIMTTMTTMLMDRQTKEQTTQIQITTREDLLVNTPGIIMIATSLLEPITIQDLRVVLIAANETLASMTQKSTLNISTMIVLHKILQNK